MYIIIEQDRDFNGNKYNKISFEKDKEVALAKAEALGLTPEVVTVVSFNGDLTDLNISIGEYPVIEGAKYPYTMYNREIIYR